jgi:hypothetical protein
MLDKATVTSDILNVLHPLFDEICPIGDAASYMFVDTHSKARIYFMLR